MQELTKVLARVDLLWCQAVKVSQQALSQRFLVFPAELFERVLQDLLPQLRQRWHQRKTRPLPEAVALALKQFERIWAVDGSTLEALFRKLDSLEDVPKGQLAGKICTVIDIVTRLRLFYAVLLDLGDAIAQELALPFDSISLEMVFRGLYHFGQAYAKGKATDPVKYLAAPENQDLGVVKALRKPQSMLVVMR